MTINYEYLEEKKKRKGRKRKPSGNLKKTDPNTFTRSAYLNYNPKGKRRTWIKEKMRLSAVRGDELVKNLARISGYSEYEVKDIMHALACLTELKLAQNIPVLIDGLGIFYRQPHQVYERDCHINAGLDLVYRPASCKFIPDKYMRDALNTTPDNFLIDWSKVDEEAIFAGIKKFYEEKYGKDFELLQEEKYGEAAKDQEELDEILEDGLKYLQQIDNSF